MDAMSPAIDQEREWLTRVFPRQITGSPKGTPYAFLYIRFKI